MSAGRRASNRAGAKVKGDSDAVVRIPRTTLGMVREAPPRWGVNHGHGNRAKKNALSRGTTQHESEQKSAPIGLGALSALALILNLD
jgi:hypothetical protein